MRRLLLQILTLLLLGVSAQEATAGISGDPNAGLVRSDIFALERLPDGSLVAGSEGLILRREVGAPSWRVVALLAGASGIRDRDDGGRTDDSDAAESFEVDFEARVEERLQELVEEELAERERDLRETIFDESLLEELLAEEEEELMEQFLSMAEMEVLEELEAETGLQRDAQGEAEDEGEEEEERRVNHLLAVPGVGGFVAASTDTGLLVSPEGRQWQRVAFGGDGAQRVRAAAWWQGELWVATAEGLHRGDPLRGRMARDTTLPLGEDLRYVAACGDTLLATDGRDVATLEGQEGTWQRASLSGAQGEGLRFLGCAAEALGAVHVASGEAGVHVWRDEASGWERVSDLGLPSRDVRMVFSDAAGEAWAATAEGVARWQEDRWSPLLEVPSGTEVFRILETVPGSLLVATRSGLYEVLSVERAVLREELTHRLEAWFADEPTFAQVVAAAHGTLGIAPLRMDHWKRQDVVWAGLAPSQVNVQGRWHQRDTFRLDRREDLPAGPVRGTDLERRQVYWEFMLRAQWDFGPFVDPEREIRIATAERNMMTTERRVSTALLRLWNERRSALLAMFEAEEADLQTRIALMMRVARVSAELDALTGWRYGFGRAVTQLMEE